MDGYGGWAQITGVGISTEWGRIMATLNEDDDAETPLQVTPWKLFFLGFFCFCTP